VAVALGTSRPDHIRDFALFLLAATLVTGLMSLIIYALYRYADRVSHVVGPTGTTIIVRLSAFLLFCIGIQVLWNGASELIAGLIAR
jgi:multiple antibiotic resistance protein